MYQEPSTYKKDWFNQPEASTHQGFSNLHPVEPNDDLIRAFTALVIKDGSGQSSDNKQKKVENFNIPPQETAEDSYEDSSSSEEKMETEEQTLEASPTKKVSAFKTKKMPKKMAKKISKRVDGNNNAHKKFVTVQNEVLSRMGSLRKIKAQLKKEQSKDFKKGSRTAFVMRLIDAKKWMNDTEFAKFLRILPGKIKAHFKLPENPNQEQKLLHRSVDYYCQSCSLFAEGKVQASVEAIYRIPGAKEEKYKEDGIRAVVEYYRKRFL